MLSAILSALSLGVTSCSENNPIYIEDITNNIVAPIFDAYLTTTTTDNFSLRIRFKNGGDDRENMSCQVHWKAYSTKPSSLPSERDLTKSEWMRIYDHNKIKTTFDTSHAGYNGGTYIYYYAECKNTKGSCKTKITYTVIKR